MANQWEPLLDQLFEAGERKMFTRRSGLVPANDIRLTINIRKSLHHKLKVRAAEKGMTIGEMIEKWIQTLS